MRCFWRLGVCSMLVGGQVRGRWSVGKGWGRPWMGSRCVVADPCEVACYSYVMGYVPQMLCNTSLGRCRPYSILSPVFLYFCLSLFRPCLSHCSVLLTFLLPYLLFFFYLFFGFTSWLVASALMPIFCCLHSLILCLCYPSPYIYI